MSPTTERISGFVAPLADELGLSVYDIDFAGGTLSVLLDRSGGVDVDVLADATRRISRWLDSQEADGTPVVPGSYTLEVSSPGLERTLRTPDHFAGAVGEHIKVKLKARRGDERRIEGVLTAADDRAVTLLGGDGTTRSVEISEIDRARTQFEWGPAPKPGGKGVGGKHRSKTSGGAGATTGGDGMSSTDEATTSEALQ